MISPSAYGQIHSHSSSLQAPLTFDNKHECAVAGHVPMHPQPVVAPSAINGNFLYMWTPLAMQPHFQHTVHKLDHLFPGGSPTMLPTAGFTSFRSFAHADGYQALGGCQQNAADLGFTVNQSQVSAGTVCRHYIKSRCNRRKCRFLHVDTPGIAVNK
uniref:C3H1-type domain-containing protein n=1 Tax=Trypanosoma vivax (strain Y486) TaxID=1055687 RepID=G0U2Y3_TRYVY|nr:conserved hypothetical protein [Trypanosoma vivax Y486]